MITKQWSVKRPPLMVVFLFVAAVMLLALTGCAATEEPELQGGYLTGATLNKDESGSDQIFSVPAAQTGDMIGVDLRGTLISGEMGVRLMGPEGEVWTQTSSNPGPFVITNNFAVGTPGDYSVQIVWEAGVNATYNLTWRPEEIVPPSVSPVAFLQGIGMILVAGGFITYAAIKRLGWGYLLFGAAAWVITVALKFAWAIAFNGPIYNAIIATFPNFFGDLLSYLYVGSLTGFTEVLITWLVLRYTKLGRVSWKKVLAFGIGFGAVEALLLGFSPLASVIAAIASPGALPLQTLEMIAQLNNPLWSLIGPFERFFTVWIHIFCNVLLFYGVATRKPGYFWAAFAYKTVLDAVAGYAQLEGITSSLTAIWIIEAIVAVMGGLGWYLTYKWAGPTYPEPTLPPPALAAESSDPV